ncbi:MAG: response regulator [bacterium]|nr:response regulator [bacterium]
MATIFVVDDEVMTVQMLTALLKLMGHETTGAHTARQALGMIEHVNPDVIMLDIMLPDVNGLQLCQELRTIPALASTPIFMISAIAPPRVTEAYEAGANGYISKPLTLNEIRSALSSVGIR